MRLSTNAAESLKARTTLIVARRRLACGCVSDTEIINCILEAKHNMDIKHIININIVPIKLQSNVCLMMADIII